jgi:FkbM family methyltransferase
MINIIDLGARGGLNFDIRKFNSEVQVFAIELDLNECARLNELEKINPDSRTRYFPIALSSTNETRNFHLTRDPACSSIYPPIEHLADRFKELDCIKLTSVESLDFITLDNWADTNGIGHVDFLKLDTQGSELDILLGSPKTLSKTSLVEIEVEFSPIYEGQPLFADVDTFMRAHGFVLWNLGNLVHYSVNEGSEILSNLVTFHNSKKFDLPSPGGQLYWGHALYISKMLLIDPSNLKLQNQIKQLIEVASVLGLYDLVKEISFSQKAI